MTPEVRKLLQDFVEFSDFAVDEVDGLCDTARGGPEVGVVSLNDVDASFDKLTMQATELRLRAEAVLDEAPAGVKRAAAAADGLRRLTDEELTKAAEAAVRAFEGDDEPDPKGGLHVVR